MQEVVFACHAARTAALVDELRRTFPNARHDKLTPGWVKSDGLEAAKVMPAIAFAVQTLPAAHEAAASSVNAWANLLYERLLARSASDDTPWRLHLVAAAEVSQRRLALIDAAVVQLLKKRRRQMLRRRVTDMAARFAKDEALVQVALLTPTTGFVSLADAAMRKTWKRTLSRFPLGEPQVAEDRGPPARAYLKLAEALQHLGRAPGPRDTCVDLGAAPGSWTYVALAHGARVIAVDRAELRADMRDDDRVEMVLGDAFKYTPPRPVEWLLCDLIAFPERTIALLDAWLQRAACCYFVVTIKFRGDDDYHKVDTCKRMLASHGATFAMRVLYHNKNEVTVYGRARAA